METKCATILGSFSKSCLTIINYLQLPAVGKGQGLFGFSILPWELICTREWCVHTLGCRVASLLVMFPSCPHAQHNATQQPGCRLSWESSATLVGLQHSNNCNFRTKIKDLSISNPGDCREFCFRFHSNLMFWGRKQFKLLVLWNGRLKGNMRHCGYLWHFRDCNHLHLKVTWQGGWKSTSLLLGRRRVTL